MSNKGATYNLLANIKSSFLITMDPIMRLTSSTIIFTALFSLLPVNVQAYVFTAPPRETAEMGSKVYQPIADFLSQATGEQFIYRQQTNWPEYVRDMRAGKYDLVFDGPHFVDWRIHNLKHHTIAKIPHLLQWRIIARTGDSTIKTLDDMVGKKACAPGSPNFGMLNMFSHFNDPAKQPIHVEVKGWSQVYEGVKNGTCDVGVLPKKNHQIYDPDKKYTKAVHTHLPYPNQAFTASESIPELVREEIRKALLSEDGQKAMIKLRERYTGGTVLVSAEDEEYDSIYSLLLKAKSFTDSVGAPPAGTPPTEPHQLVNN